ncbi:MAG: hypothetical protein CYPHOPRED_002009 [Cyphobasidiales sp. Tagirdzhanova-0007]|nr:MAG: hypothetical protein CYPHOPRED_002009 [Cyphobasidiales sp. Tagirdzhanova-0007]
MSKPSILYTGLKPNHPAAQAIVDPEVIAKMLEQSIIDMRSAGYEDFTGCWIDPDEGTDELVRLLRSKQWHGLLIGAGVRKSDSEVAWLETLIQTTKEESPHTQIIFNTSPKDNEAAAKRLKFP